MISFNFGRTVVVRLFIFAACFSLIGCGNKSRSAEANSNSAPARQAISVTTSKAITREVPSVIQATGSLVAEESSNVAPKTAGKVVNVSANVGQFVKQGAVIARIDDRDAQLRLAEARASVKVAQTAVRSAETRLGLSPNGSFAPSSIPEVRVANSNYEQAAAELRQAEANEKRYRELVETGDVAMIDYEQFRTARDTARTRLNSAKQQLEVVTNAARTSNEAIKAAQAQVESARTQVQTAEQAIADTVVRAPFSGFVSERQVAVGEFATSATTIATIVRTNPIKAEIQIPEAEVPFVALGRGVTLKVDAYSDRTFGGTVSAVNPSISADSRSAIVEALVENNENKLRAGMFATATITRDGGTVGVFVPIEAVYDDQATQNKRVFVIVEGIVKLRTVKVGLNEDGMTQILDGVAADEIVATSNLAQLYEGAEVSVG